MRMAMAAVIAMVEGLIGRLRPAGFAILAGGQLTSMAAVAMAMAMQGRAVGGMPVVPMLGGGAAVCVNGVMPCARVSGFVAVAMLVAMAAGLVAMGMPRVVGGFGAHECYCTPWGYYRVKHTIRRAR
jgi:hypothetical protein